MEDCAGVGVGVSTENKGNTMSKLSALSDDELRKLALEKGRRGNASSTALQAQRVLCELAGVERRRDRANTASDDYCYGEPNRFTKRFG